MHRARFPSCLVLMVLSGVNACAFAGDQVSASISRSLVRDAGIDMRVTAPRSMPAGQACMIKISVVNRSKHPVQIIPTGDVFADIKLTVTDSFGRPVPWTRFGDQQCTRFLPSGYKTFKPRTLGPGQAWTTQMNVSLVYDMSLPMDYVVSAALHLFARDDVKSRTILVSPGLRLRVTKPGMDTSSGPARKEKVAESADVTFLPHRLRSLGEDINLVLDKGRKEWTFVDNAGTRLFGLPRAIADGPERFMPARGGMIAHYRWVKVEGKGLNAITQTIYDRSGKPVCKIQTDRWRITVYPALDLVISHGARVGVSGRDFSYGSFRAFRLSTGKPVNGELPEGVYFIVHLAPVSSKKSFVMILGPKYSTGKQGDTSIRLLKFDKDTKLVAEHKLKMDTHRTMPSEWSSFSVAFWPDKVVGLWTWGPAFKGDLFSWKAFFYDATSDKITYRKVNGFIGRAGGCFAAKKHLLLLGDSRIGLFAPEAPWYGDDRRMTTIWKYFVQMQLSRRPLCQQAGVSPDGSVAVIIPVASNQPTQILVVSPDRQVKHVISVRPVVSEVKFSEDGKSLLILGHGYAARAILEGK